MKILECDVCNVRVNDYDHWYNKEKPRDMYELKCLHEYNDNNYAGMVICHECIAKLLTRKKGH